MSFLRIALCLSLSSFAVTSRAWTGAQEPHSPAPKAASANGSSPGQSPDSTQTVTSSKASTNLVQLRQLIDRGGGADALKQLDDLATQHPGTPGVDRMRGLALYSLNRFAEADAAFAAALSRMNKMKSRGRCAASHSSG